MTPKLKNPSAVPSRPRPLHNYDPGTWGPAKAEELTTGICGCDSPVWLLPHGKDSVSS